VSGVEPAYLVARKGFILPFRDKRRHDIGKKLEPHRRVLVGGESQWCPGPTSRADPGFRLGQTSASAQPVSSQPGLSQTDSGLRICEQELSSGGNW